MKKQLIGLALLSIFLSGCTSKDENLEKLATISAMNNESKVSKSYNLSYSESQNMIYAQVSDRTLLDLSALSKCSENEIQQVRNYMDLVDKQLTGLVKTVEYKDTTNKLSSDGLVVDNSVIDAKMTDYLLSLMQYTPYYWQRTATTIRGIDSKSRSVIVDVTYKTIDFDKTVIDDSKIVRGDENYDTLSLSRYTKWLEILNHRYNNQNSTLLPKLESDFKRYWGEPEDIIKEQRRHSNTYDIYLTGNQKTYKGLIDSDYEKSHGTMTVRYVLVPNYSLGINLGIKCEHLYLTQYDIEDFTKDLGAFKEEGYQTVTDNVYKLIYSYFTSMDENDFSGLYKLTSDFQMLDKHYEDMFNSSYQKHEGYSVSLFDIRGTHIACGITISTKERAKMSDMTMPVYTDRYYAELELLDGKLKINNLVLISRKLEGEPAINEDEIDSTGFAPVIELNNDDKLAIEKLICDFGVLQLKKDTQSDDFVGVVDSSMPSNQFNSLKTNMTSLSGAKKVVFLQTYQQGNSNYASVKCKELYQDSTNAITESTATYEFIVKGGKWYIFNYDINSSIKLDTTNLQINGSLCLVTPEKVETYTSQLRATTSSDTEVKSDNVVTFKHEEYKPQLKDGVKEQGLVLYKREDITEDIYSKIANIAGFTYTKLEDYNTFISSLGEHNKNFAKELDKVTFRILVYYINIVDSRYTNNSDRLDELGKIKKDLESSTLNQNPDDIEDTTIRNLYTDAKALLSNLETILQE